MIEMKDCPNHPKTELNSTPLYRAVWPKSKIVDDKIVFGEISSGWREDQADTTALAIRMNGYLVRGYFGGFA